tara:strand:+ start:25918 stop:27813 length:1896 start_codon:yes stop_codon:yes gene_type:complete
MNGNLFLDRLTFLSFLKILFFYKNYNILIIDDLKKSNFFFTKLLGLRKNKIKEINFFLGDLKTKDNKNLFELSRSISSRLSFEISNNICKEPILKDLNQKYGNRTIQLFIAKKIFHYIEFYTGRILIKEHFSKSNKDKILLPSPLLFDKKELIENFNTSNLDFYFSPFSNTGAKIKNQLNLEFSFVFNILNFSLKKILSSFFYFFVNKKTFFEEQKNNFIMSPLESNVEQTKIFKNQFFWMNDKAISFKNLLFSETLKDFNIQKKNNLYFFVNLRDSLFFYTETRKKPLIKKIRKEKRRLFFSFFSTKTNLSNFILFEIYKVFDTAQFISSVVIFFKIKSFLFYRSDFPSTDAAQLFAKELKLTTNCFQYSNMNSQVPTMLSTADNFLLFSEYYEKFFKTDLIKPKNFIMNGYPYNYSSEAYKNEIERIRTLMRLRGVEYSITYFNESEQVGKWGHTNEKFNIKILEFFSKLLIDNKKLGLLLKPQKTGHSFTKYIDSDLIKKAYMTGRLLELNEESKSQNTYGLNTVYPSMAALASDLTIGHVFGGTASLEAALTGTKSVLLNLNNEDDEIKDILKKENIIFNSLNELEKEIMKNDKNDLGDWKNIIEKFDKFKDSNGAERINNILKTNF